MTQVALGASISFEEIAQRAVVNGLQSVLGDTAKVLVLYLDPAIAVRKPDPYVRCLLKCIPVEDKVDALVSAIGQQLYQSIGIQFDEKGGRKLSDYINEARQYYTRRTSGH